ncbi:Major facilitator superfamily domain general substrate transporter protein [Rutstroemia sp. NJR-2017a BBW]|nr:Major facilitator superfamily domain general substrate transporter protein [Rutstroemia sp. NJR-2017a BBW]
MEEKATNTPFRAEEGQIENTVGQKTPQDEDPASSLPKEDLIAWLQVLGAFCLNLNTWGLMNAFGVYQTFYKLDLLSAHSSSDISWIGSTQAFLMFLTSVVAGPIFDAGHLSFLLWTGSLFTVLGMFLTSICKTYYQCFLAQGVMMGLGFGLLYLPAPAIVSQFFHARRSLAIGMSSVGSALGGVIYPIVFTQLQPRIGFGWATRVVAFIIFGTSIIPLLVMKSRSVASPWRTVLDATALRDVPYILLNSGLLFGFMGLWVIFYYIQLYALQRSSVSSELASYLLVIINASSLPGRLLPGFYADKVGSINVQTVVAASSAILTFCLIAIRSTGGLIVYSLLYGFSAGAFMGLPAAGVARLSEDHSKIGIRLGMTLGFVGFGVLVSNPIAGAILAVNGSWTGLIVWCGALLTASTLSMAASRVVKVGYSLTKVI